MAGPVSFSGARSNRRPAKKDETVGLGERVPVARDLVARLDEKLGQFRRRARLLGQRVQDLLGLILADHVVVVALGEFLEVDVPDQPIVPARLGEFPTRLGFDLANQAQARDQSNT